MTLTEIRTKIAERTDDQLHNDLEEVQRQIDDTLEREDRDGTDAGTDYEALCLIRRELVTAGLRRKIIEAAR
jgi:hypothetical protein